MTTVTYTAERELVAGHTASTSYELAIRCREIAPSVDEKKKKALTISGAVSETIVLRRKKMYQVTTAAVTGNERANMREFLESVSEGEQFTFDQFATVGVPVDPQAVELEGSYSELRAVRQGDGGGADHFRYSFKIREK